MQEQRALQPVLQQEQQEQREQRERWGQPVHRGVQEQWGRSTVQ